MSTLFDTRKLYIYRNDDPLAVVNRSCAIIRAPEKNDYIISYLRTLEGKKQFLSDATQATRGTCIPHLSIASLAQIEIPLLPLSELQRLGDQHIERSPSGALIQLREELENQLNALPAADKKALRDVVAYFENRIEKIEAELADKDLDRKIAHGETSKLEFKSTLRWNLKTNRDDPQIELTFLKAIAAFCNSEGGELLIGVDDNGKAFGIKHDHFENGDRFLLHLRNLIHHRLIPNVTEYVDYELVNHEGKQICRVVCKRSPDDVWLKPDKTNRELFYIRSGPSSTELPPREASRYIRQHFKHK